jgi:hypothetical protein
MDQQFSSCADCKLETPNACKKFNNPISKVFAFIFGSNREKCILTIRETGLFGTPRTWPKPGNSR